MRKEWGGRRGGRKLRWVCKMKCKYFNKKSLKIMLDA